MRLVISGYYGFGNAGDEAVLAGMLELSGRAGVRRDDVSVLSADPRGTSSAHEVRAVSRWNPLQVAAELRRADALLSGGGGLLQDVSSLRPVSYYAGVMALARLLGRPYAVVAQGLGPLRRGPNRRLARSALDHAAYVSLRDERSIALSRRIGVQRPIQLSADPALAALSSAAHEGSGASHVLVAVRGGYPADAAVGPLRHAVAVLARERPVIALPMHETVDRDASTALVAGIPGASLADPEGSLGSKLEAIATAAVVIGVRLHALVLAAAAGVPAVAITYDPKVDAFAERAGIAVVGSTRSPIDPAAVVAAVSDALARGEDAYGDQVAGMRAEADADMRAAVAAISRTP